MATKAKAAALAAATAPASAPAPAPAPVPAPVAPSDSDVALVTGAAKEVDKATAAANPEEAKALEVAGSAVGFEAAAAVGNALAPIALIASPLDEARANAQALADAENEQGTPLPRLETPEFPFDLRVINNSSLSLTEKVSGALLPAGGSATINLHDEQHASKVGKSLYELAEKNYLPRDALVFQLA